MRKLAASVLLAVCCTLGLSSAQPPPAAAPPPSTTPGIEELVDPLLAAHPGKTGAFVLERGADALIARAWLADHARTSIDVQYFIWSSDNIGILASEALLRAADRGVKVRVIVDDLLINAPDEALIALARHPNIDIRIYNPKVSVGVQLSRRLLNLVTDFHGLNQRMHDKTFVVDGKVAITGGRNMAVEYFDYNHQFNFRDRDVLLLGAAAADVRRHFETFWAHPLAEDVETLFDGKGLWKKSLQLDDSEVQQIYRDLHSYARDPANFATEVHALIEAVPQQAHKLMEALIWGDVEFIGDIPGKNDGSFDGGGRSSSALAKLVQGAKQRIVIQSPYLVMSDRALALFAEARQRGVQVRVNTNSLASTDNLQAFSGYRNQREELLALGLEIFEARPDAQIQRELMHREGPAPQTPPIFSLHAKTMVIDGETVYIGTFNLDPRSENLNTEVGAILRDGRIAAGVEAGIEADMRPENSWNAATDDPDQYTGWFKRLKVWLFQLLPLRPIL